MKIWRRILAVTLCIALVLTAVNIDSIISIFNAIEPDNVISIDSDSKENDTDSLENSNLIIDDISNEIVNAPSPAGDGSSFSGAAREGYHMYNGVEYPNMYQIFYNPNNGESEYEKENNQYQYNQINSMHFYDHGSSYNGLPVYSSLTDPELFRGEKGIDYLVDDLMLSKNLFDRDNYNFIGWNEESDADFVQYQDGEYITNLSNEDNDIVYLYAMWEIAQTSFDIVKNGGTFDWDAFFELNDIDKDKAVQNGDEILYTLSDGSVLKVIEDDNRIYFEADCLTTLHIPDMLSPSDDLKFVGFDTSTKNWNDEENTIFFENKNSKPSMRALFLSSLTLDGVVDIHGFDGEGSISLSWGTLGHDDIEKVYKIAQSFDGVNFEYIPDNNFTELIEGVEYGYTGSVQTFTAPIAGKYYIEAWGANGGIGYTTEIPGGNGGKASGYVNLKEGQTIYLFVGEAGKTYAEAGTKRSYGGGGAAPIPSKIWRPQGTTAWQLHVQGRGGGATYVSLTNEEISGYIPENYTSIDQVTLTNMEAEAVEKAKSHVLMLAAGGSGRGDGSRGADGGGLVGPTVVDSDYHYGNVNVWTATGATQTSAGYGAYGTLNGLQDDNYYRTTTYGTFFYGSNGMTCSGAGGGGWFGGGMCYYVGGSGASSYLGTEAGLYDADTIIGGNIENIHDAANPWHVNGKVRIKICDYWITTNTSEKIYSPDKAAPDEPANVESTLDNSEDGKGTVTWEIAEDNGTDYWYRVDAFDADNFSNKISESEVKKFTVTSGTTGYYYIIDGNEDTIVHPGNGTFTEDTSVSGIDMLDVGMPKYIHICTVDDAGNYSGTVTILLNRVTVVIDPNKGGTYNGSYDVQSFILKPGDVYNVLNIVADQNQKFVDWAKTTGDGIFDKENNTITMQYAKTTIVASYMAPLILEAKINYVMNNKKGAIDLTWHQDDEIHKTYKVYVSPDDPDGQEVTWEPIRVAFGAEGKQTDFEYTEDGYQVYKVPGDGIYTLTAYGAAGEDYGNYKGGAGSSVTGTFHLTKGDVLYIFTGGKGTNGGGSGSAEGGAGGGATDIRLNGTDISDRILVAAGGAGANPSGNGAIEKAGQSNNGVLSQGTNAAEDVSEPKITPVIPMSSAPDPYSINVSGGGGGYYGGTAGYKTAKAEQKRISQKEYNNLPVEILHYTTERGYYAVPKLLNSTPITVSSYSVNITNSSYQQNGVSSTFLRGKQVWLYTLDEATVNGTTYYRYAYDGDGGFTINGVKYAENVGVWVSNVKPTSVYVGFSLAPSGASGYHIHNKPWPITAAGDKNPGTISTIKVQTFVWKSPSYKAGMAGISYVNNNIGTTEKTSYGVNTGNGKASITVYDYSSGDMDEVAQDGTIAIDYAAPNAPYGGRILSSNGTNAVLTWVKPDDNGTPYWNRAESYYADTLEKINDSNITETNVVTGVEKYRWYADYNEVGEVNGTNSVESVANQITTPSENLTMYYHVAAVDYAGNIGPTYTFNPIEGIDIEVTVIWEDEQNSLSTRPVDNVSVSLYRVEDTDGDGVPEKILVQTLPLETYGDIEKLLFEHLPSVDEDGNVIKYIAQIDGVESDNDFYDYITSYSDDTFTITNTLEKINRAIHIDIEWDDIDNKLDTRPDTFIIEIIDKDGNVVKTVEVENLETEIEAPVSLGEDFDIRVTGIDSKHPENSYTTTVTNNGKDSYTVVNVLNYQLTVKPNGGLWEGSRDDQNFSLDANGSMALPDPVRTGYKFLGWDIDGDATIIDGVITIGKGNVTVIAKWEKIPYTLRVDPNGGIFEKSTSVSQYTMTYGDKRIISVPERTGYTFIGWTLEGTGATMTSMTEKSLFTMGASDATLKANWVPRKIIVTLEPNGGTVEKDKLEVTYENPYGPIPVPEKPGCEFITWSLDPEGNYPVDENSIVEINEDHILYAQYMPKTITLNGRVVWIDENNKFGSRPDSLMVDILSNGEHIAYVGEEIKEGMTVETTKATWTFSRELLQEYDITNNTPIEYSVILSPDPAESMNVRYAYETTYSVDPDGTFVITNTVYEAKQDVPIKLTWVDKSNAWGSRPDTVDVILYADGVEVSRITLSADFADKDNSDVWTHVFKEMDIYNQDGSEIKYTVKVNPDPTPSNNTDDAYETTYDGLNITETLINANKVVKGTITWVDNDNKYHYRPETTTIILYKITENSKEQIGSLVVPSTEKDFIFENLPKYDENYNLIKYGIEEIIDDTYSVKINEREIKNSAGIVDNVEFDVINTFIPVENATPYTNSDVYMRVIYEDEEIFDEIGFNKDTMLFPVRLHELEKIFSGENGVYDITYGNETGNVFSAVLTNEYLHINGLVPGKYLIDIEVKAQFEFVNMLSSLEDGAKIVNENGNWYLIIDQEVEESTIHIDAVMKPVWRGYCDRKLLHNYFSIKH